MSGKWALLWLFIAIAGFESMIYAYSKDRDPSDAASEQYFLYIAERPEAESKGGTPVVVFFSPPGADLEEKVDKLGGMYSVQGRRFLRNHQIKLVLFRDFGRRYTTDMLESGRLPRAGSTEIIADADASPYNQIPIGDKTLHVVGVLKKWNSLHQDACYAFDDPGLRQMIDPNGKAFHNGFLVPWKDVFLSKALENTMEKNAVSPQDPFTEVVGAPRLDRNTFYIYVTGMFFFIFGASSLLIQLYRNVAPRTTGSLFGPPLTEINRHWILFALLHVAFFGIMLVVMIIIYDMPMTQDFYSEMYSGQVESNSGTPALAAKAYGSGIIALAAVVTLVINFLPVSILQITMPSFIIPGIGVVMIFIYAVRWGIVLSPASSNISGTMLFHTPTLLLEGEGYILATFFASLVPFYLFNPALGKKIRFRYWKALMINFKGNIIVLILLAIAATYEAIEIILYRKIAAIDALFQLMR
jgi:hypothetical protein